MECALESAAIQVVWGTREDGLKYRWQYYSNIVPRVGEALSISTCRDEDGRFFKNGFIVIQVPVVKGRVADVEVRVDQREKLTQVTARVTLDPWENGPWWDQLDKKEETECETK